MRHRALPAFALVLAAAIAVGGCATVTAGTASARHPAPASAVPTAVPTAAPTAAATATGARARAPVYGPPGPDLACAAALRAEQALRARQGKDQDNESALDQDFTNFASALSAAARQETHPATATAMTTLASDFSALVESQSGAGELPGMNTVEKDGAAFDKACSYS